MSSCNTTSNERGGKDLLLKVCKTISVSMASGSATITTSTAHGLSVGDLFRVPGTVPGSVTEVVSGSIYFVVSVASTTTFTISATIGGSAISFAEVVSALSSDAFTQVGGLRTHGAALAADAIENSNYGNNQWRSIVDGAGMRQYTISGDGVYNVEDSFKLIRTAARANALICLAFIDSIKGEILNGCFKITSLDSKAAFDGEATFTMSAVSSGQVDLHEVS